MAHDRVNVVCENMCFEEGMTKEQILAKFNTLQTALNELTSKIQKVSGSATFDNSATATVEINYPQGFGPENCIAFGGMTKGLHSAKWKNNVGITTGTSQIAINPIITFLDDKIRVEIKTTSAISQSVSYQFYLMSIGF